MEYGKPSKLQDGRYFLRITNKEGSRVLKQINNVEIQEANCLKVPASVDLREFDDDILVNAEKNSEEWFGKKFDMDSLKKAFDSSVNTGLLEAPLARRGGVVATRVFDSDRKEISPDGALVPGTKCDVVVELAGLWFLKKSFGPVWRLVQARLKKESTFPNKYMFSDEGNESEDEYYV